MFEKILVPIDGSEHSLKALKQAAEIAKRCESEKFALVNVYSVTRFDVDKLGSGVRWNDETYNKLGDLARGDSARILADGKNMAKAQGVPVDTIETLSMEGDVVETIVEAAREGEFSLIVLGHRGLSRGKYLVIGHICEGVIRHAPCPVLVAR